MMYPSGTKFSGDKIFSQSDLRAGTVSDRIINEERVNKRVITKKEVNRIATWNVRSLGVCGKLKNLKAEMKRLNINIL
jgi:uncharacterized protein YtpQ (UPF0354 family)